MKWNNDIFKRYMEAGLAVLIVLTLGLAGAAGVLSPRAAESEQTRLPGMTAQMPVKKMRIRIL